jgi:hypothetical protein
MYVHECLFICLTSKPENLLGHLNFVGVLGLASLAYLRSAPASMCLLYVFLVKFQAMKVLEVTDE